MVRRGKVSKGCQTCRKRKIKCDQLRPACTQCLSAGWDCPQYGDALDRVFQNQTINTFKAARDEVTPKPQLEAPIQNEPLRFEIVSMVTQRRRVPLPPAATTTVACKPNRERIPDAARPRILNAIVPPINDRAINLFLRAHVFQDSTAPRGYFEFLSPLCENIKPEEPLHLSLNAVGLAAFANTVNSSELLKQARGKLILAIQAVNLALDSREEATADSTLTAILLLSTFETLTCRDQQSLRDCDTHLNAATTLIKLRGFGQFQTQIGIQLFLQMIANILMGCFQRSVRVPPDVITYRNYAAAFLDTSTPRWRLSSILINFSELRASIRDGTISEPCEIINASLEIDTELDALSTSMPEGWDFETVVSYADPELVYMKHYHIYPDLWVAMLWNCLRTCRLIVHQEICAQLDVIEADAASPILEIQEAQREISMAVMEQSGSDICASIPQYGGYLALLSKARSSSPNSPEEFSRPTGSMISMDALLPNGDVPMVAGTYFILWQLLKVGEAPSTTSCQKNWIINRLKHLGNFTGIQQAFGVADVLESGCDIDAWT